MFRIIQNKTSLCSLALMRYLRTSYRTAWLTYHKHLAAMTGQDAKAPFLHCRGRVQAPRTTTAHLGQHHPSRPEYDASRRLTTPSSSASTSATTSAHLPIASASASRLAELLRNLLNHIALTRAQTRATAEVQAKSGGAETNNEMRLDETAVGHITSPLSSRAAHTADQMKPSRLSSSHSRPEWSPASRPSADVKPLRPLQCSRRRRDTLKMSFETTRLMEKIPSDNHGFHHRALRRSIARIWKSSEPLWAPYRAPWNSFSCPTTQKANREVGLSACFY